jgi:hypothetical protein
MNNKKLKATIKAAGATLLLCLVALPIYAGMMTVLVYLLLGWADAGIASFVVILLNIPLAIAWMAAADKLMSHFMEGFTSAG